MKNVLSILLLLLLLQGEVLARGSSGRSYSSGSHSSSCGRSASCGGQSNSFGKSFSTFGQSIVFIRRQQQSQVLFQFAAGHVVFLLRHFPSPGGQFQLVRQRILRRFQVLFVRRRQLLPRQVGLGSQGELQRGPDFCRASGRQPYRLHETLQHACRDGQDLHALGSAKAVQIIRYVDEARYQNYDSRTRDFLRQTPIRPITMTIGLPS